MPTQDPLYDAAVAEVRGEATPEQIALLDADHLEWRDALQRVLDEVDAQFEMKREQFEDDTYGMSPGGSAYNMLADTFERWQHGARTFKKHIAKRYRSVDRLYQQTLGNPFQDDVIRKAIILIEVDQRFTDHEADQPELDDAIDSLRYAVENLLVSDSQPRFRV